MANKKLDLKKYCVICHEKINFKSERYVNLRDFNAGNFESECFYHLECWKNKFQIQQQKALAWVKPSMQNLLSKLKGLGDENGIIAQ